jgi:hypothetical protein
MPDEDATPDSPLKPAREQAEYGVDSESESDMSELKIEPEPKAIEASPAQRALNERIRIMVEQAKLSLAMQDQTPDHNDLLESHRSSPIEVSAPGPAVDEYDIDLALEATLAESEEAETNMLQLMLQLEAEYDERVASHQPPVIAPTAAEYDANSDYKAELSEFEAAMVRATMQVEADQSMVTQLEVKMSELTIQTNVLQPKEPGVSMDPAEAKNVQPPPTVLGKRKRDAEAMEGRSSERAFKKRRTQAEPDQIRDAVSERLGLMAKAAKLRFLTHKETPEDDGEIHSARLGHNLEATMHLLTYATEYVAVGGDASQAFGLTGTSELTNQVSTLVRHLDEHIAPGPDGTYRRRAVLEAAEEFVPVSPHYMPQYDVPDDEGIRYKLNAALSDPALQGKPVFDLDAARAVTDGLAAIRQSLFTAVQGLNPIVKSRGKSGEQETPVDDVESFLHARMARGAELRRIKGLLGAVENDPTLRRIGRGDERARAAGVLASKRLADRKAESEAFRHLRKVLREEALVPRQPLPPRAGFKWNAEGRAVLSNRDEIAIEVDRILSKSIPEHPAFSEHRVLAVRTIRHEGFSSLDSAGRQAVLDKIKQKEPAFGVIDAADVYRLYNAVVAYRQIKTGDAAEFPYLEVLGYREEQMRLRAHDVGATPHQALFEDKAIEDEPVEFPASLISGYSEEQLWLRSVEAAGEQKKVEHRIKYSQIREVLNKMIPSVRYYDALRTEVIEAVLKIEKIFKTSQSVFKWNQEQKKIVRTLRQPGAYRYYPNVFDDDVVDPLRILVAPEERALKTLKSQHRTDLSEGDALSIDGLIARHHDITAEAAALEAFSSTGRRLAGGGHFAFRVPEVRSVPTVIEQTLRRGVPGPGAPALGHEHTEPFAEAVKQSLATVWPMKRGNFEARSRFLALVSNYRTALIGRPGGQALGLPVAECEEFWTILKKKGPEISELATNLHRYHLAWSGKPVELPPPTPVACKDATTAPPMKLILQPLSDEAQGKLQRVGQYTIEQSFARARSIANRGRAGEESVPDRGLEPRIRATPERW